MSNLIPLTFNTIERGSPVAHVIRTIRENGTRWFIAADLCRALDLHVRTTGVPNTAIALRHLDASEKAMRKLELIPGRPVRTLMVTDAGFYKMIHRSKRSASSALRGWAKRHLDPALSAALEVEPTPSTIPAALRARAAELLALAGEYESGGRQQAA